MPRPIWKGAISFGMVTIPVRLFAATSDKDVSFHLLHKEDNSRLKFVRWCPVEDRAVQAEEIVRGYEYAKGQYVVLTDEDFDRLPLPTRHTVELQAFVRAEEIEPVFYDKSYYLEPDPMGVKAFALLMRALSEKGLTAVGRVALRTKERMCALSPRNAVLMLETLFYPDEVQVEKETAPEVLVSRQELAMASTFIDLLSGPFQPEKYRDRYRDALMELIESKLRGQPLVEAPPAPAPAVPDLMAALRASVAAAKKGKPAEEPEEAAPEVRRAAS